MASRSQTSGIWRSVSLISLFLICAGTCGSGAEEATSEEQPKFAPSEFNTLAQPIGNLLALRIKNGQLILDRERWDRPFKGKSLEEKLKIVMKNMNSHMPENWRKRSAIGLIDQPPVVRAFLQLQNAAGSSGGSGSSGGMNSKSWSFRRDKLSGKLKLSNDTHLSVRLIDEGSQDGLSVLLLKDKGDGAIIIGIILGLDGPILNLKQTPDSKIVMSFFHRGKMHKYSASSFDSFLAEDGHPGEKHLFPLLRYVGIQIPPSQNPEMVKATIAILDSQNPAIRKKLTDLFQKLDAEDFPTREKAGKEIVALGGLARETVKEKLKDKKLSVEARSKLEQIHEQLKDSGKDMAEARAQGLIDDAEFLVRILPNITDENHTRLVCKRLTALTGQSIEDKPAAWQTWWKSNGKAWVEKNEKAKEEKEKSTKKESE